MSIQQDINSALGQVGVLAALNPTVQAKAKEREDIKKIEKQEKVLYKQFDATREKYFETKGAQAEGEESEIKAAKVQGKKHPKVLLTPETYKRGLGQEVGNMRNLAEKKLQLAQEKFDIAPSRESYKGLTGAQTAVDHWKEQQANVGKPVTYEGEVAWEAIERAKRIQDNKNASRARRDKLLYGEMERMMPGFKYMEPKKQNKIIKDLGTDERKRIKDEAERREKYYGK